jgi:hypothetical protein
MQRLRCEMGDLAVADVRCSWLFGPWLASDIALPTLPPGCHLQLDRQASEIVLRNVRASLRIDWTGLVSELRRLGDISLGDFLDETGLDLDDVYRRCLQAR